MERMMSGVVLSFAVLLLGLLVWALRSTKISRGTVGVVVFLGLAICIVAAMRDGYGFSSTAVLAFSGVPALLFSLGGLVILALCAVALASSAQLVRHWALVGVTGLFIVKLVAMELIRFLV